MPRSVTRVHKDVYDMFPTLLPKGVKRYGADRIREDGYDVTVQGKAIPKVPRVQMWVTLEMVDGNPVRKLSWEPVENV